MASCAMKFQLSLDRHCPMQFPWWDNFHGTTLNSKKKQSIKSYENGATPINLWIPINYIHCPCFLLTRNEPRTGCTKNRSSKTRSTRCDAAKSHGTYHGKSFNSWWFHGEFIEIWYFSNNTWNCATKVGLFVGFTMLILATESGFWWFNGDFIRSMGCIIIKHMISEN